MHFLLLSPASPLWQSAAAYAAGCPWKAGQALAARMEAAAFEDWERVLIAMEDEAICGFCTVSKTDCIAGLPYTPYIGFLFVAQSHRGKRLSQRMTDYAGYYLASLGFENVYLISDHVGLYEKYGFHVIDRKTAPWGAEEKIYTRKLAAAPSGRS